MLVSLHDVATIILNAYQEEELKAGRQVSRTTHVYSYEFTYLGTLTDTDGFLLEMIENTICLIS